MRRSPVLLTFWKVGEGWVVECPDTLDPEQMALIRAGWGRALEGETIVFSGVRFVFAEGELKGPLLDE